MLLLTSYGNFSKNMYSSFQDIVDNTGNIFINFLKIYLLYDLFQYICIFVDSMLWYIKAYTTTIKLLETYFNLLILPLCFVLYATHYIHSLICFLCTVCTKWMHTELTMSLCPSNVCMNQLENHWTISFQQTTESVEKKENSV
jgi:hypothetical protein